MAKSKKAEVKLAQQWWFWVLIGITACAMIVAIVAINSLPSKPKGLELNYDQWAAVGSLETSTTIAKYRDMAKNDVPLPKAECNIFRDLAKQFDKNAKWFSDSFCSYSIEADLIENDTEMTIYLQDKNYCAEYTLAKKQREDMRNIDDLTLTDYQFTTGKCNSAYRVYIED